MQRIAALCDTRMFVMADVDSSTVEEGLRISRRKARNPIAFLGKLLPQGAASLMWRSDIRTWLAQEKPSIVHFHNPHPPGALLDAARACVEQRIPYVISTHGFVEFNDFSRGFRRPYWQRALIKYYIRRPIVEVVAHASRVLMLSPLEEPILIAMGARRDKLDIVSNGVDPYFLEDVGEEGLRKSLERFNLPQGKLLMLFVGNHTQNKGLDIFLRAVAIMGGQTTAVIAGAIRSRAEHAQLLSSCGILESDPRVVFTDFISKEELRALYNTADMFVFPSRADTLPLVILEAMASGLPVVSTRVGGIPYQVTPNTGILVEPDDARGLADALTRLCSDAALRHSLGDAARERVCRLFDWQVSAQHAVEVYQQVLLSQGA
jgi:glycosyltransferase involved in cell wall biosynthesis